MAHHEIDLLLSCRDIIVEPLEAAIFVPSVDEIRECKKHGYQRIIKVGTPYWVEDNSKEMEKGN